MAQRIPITPAGYQNLVLELDQLKKIERPKVIQDIATARAHGDLSENAEYDAAKEKQGFIEGRIRELETTLAFCDVIDPKTLQSSKIVFGATVCVLDLDTDTTCQYTLVGEYEANVRSGLLNINSPLAKALLGKAIGDEVEFHAPGGVKAFEILDILFE